MSLDEEPVVPCAESCEVEVVDWDSDEFQDLSEAAFLTMVDSVAVLVNYADDAVAELTLALGDPYSDDVVGSDQYQLAVLASDCEVVGPLSHDPSEDPCGTIRGVAEGVKYATIGAVATCGLSAVHTFFWKWSVKTTHGLCMTAWGAGVAAIQANNEFKSCKRANPDYYPVRPT